MTTFTNNRSNTTENGSGALEVILVLLLLGFIVFAGFFVVNRQADNTADTSTQEAPLQEQVEINDSGDLQVAEEDLFDINLDELDTTELDEAEVDLL
jgi:cytochrome b